jgi:hypothetical protein
MGKIEIIEQEIEKLSPSELATFRNWFTEFDAEVWDRQIENNSKSGKLDALAEEAIGAFKSGRCSEL